ncbi:MAG: isoprenylcysteine carboxylmethyltransferase family protein [Elusimicrobia bacterium]|nr:isoprenylcysteine carboxylmethyltransferase family protein [Elusimicrobiota bacterium]
MYNNLRRFLAFLFAIAVFYLGIKSGYVFYWAILIILLGQIIRIWAAGYLRKKKILSVVGPYRYVRNPLYAGSLFIGIGFGLFIWNFYVLSVLLVFFIGIYTLKINSEEKKLEEIFAEQYVEYKKHVPRWFPTLKPYKTSNEPGEFDLKLAIIKNKEYNSILGCIGMLILILIFKK